MNLKKLFIVIFLVISFFYLKSFDIFQNESNMTISQKIIGNKMANEFCKRRKPKNLLKDSLEEILNKTYLKSFAYPDDGQEALNFINFSIEKIKYNCGEYLTTHDEKLLMDFFKEEYIISSDKI